MGPSLQAVLFPADGEKIKLCETGEEKWYNCLKIAKNKLSFKVNLQLGNIIPGSQTDMYIQIAGAKEGHNVKKP